MAIPIFSGSNISRPVKVGGCLAGLAILTLGLGSCSVDNTGDLRKEYTKQVAKMGLTPVYPPREEFQVGDVYFVSYDSNNPTDPAITKSVWLATVPYVRQAANGYLRTRINFDDTSLSNNDAAFIQSDMSAGVVTLNDGARTSLPIVSFPSVSATASSAGDFGGYGFMRSFGFSFGQSEQVHLNFNDTRAFGVPVSTLSLSRLSAELKARICGEQLPNALLVAKSLLDKNIDPGTAICAHSEDEDNPRRCSVAVVTRTILTRQLTYSYSSAQIAKFAATLAKNPIETPDTTQQLPASVNLDISVGENANDKLLENLIKSMERSTVSGTKSESTGLNFAGVQGASLVFERNFQKPVSIAYEALPRSLESTLTICNDQNLAKRLGVYYDEGKSQ